MMKTLLTATVLVGAMTVGASAASFTFNASSPQLVNQIVTSNDGIGLTVLPGNDVFGAQISQNDFRGIGVLNTYEKNNGGISIPELPADGNGSSDFLEFTFDKVVEMTSVVVTNANYANWNTNYSNATTFDVIIDDIETIIISLAAGWNSTGIDITSFFDGYSGSKFKFLADAGGEAFKVRSFGVTEVSQVPVPAALPLLGAGLVGLGLMGRRRKAKAAA